MKQKKCLKLVIDANILFAALIKKGLTADLLFEDKLELYAPEFLLKEFNKYENHILKKSKLDFYEFELILNLIKKRINWLSTWQLNKTYPLAKIISPDLDDVEYFSAALFLNCPLWTNDKLLKNQNQIKIYTTSNVFSILQ